LPEAPDLRQQDHQPSPKKEQPSLLPIAPRGERDGEG